MLRSIARRKLVPFQPVLPLVCGWGCGYNTHAIEGAQVRLPTRQQQQQ